MQVLQSWAKCMSALIRVPLSRLRAFHCSACVQCECLHHAISDIMTIMQLSLDSFLNNCDMLWHACMQRRIMLTPEQYS